MKRVLVSILLLLGSFPISGSASPPPPEAGPEVVRGEFLVKGPVASGPGIASLQPIGEWTLVRATGLPGDPMEAAASLQSTLGTEVVPNYILHLASDPLFPDQWPLENTGQSGGTSNADIDAPEAWAITTGASSVVVAVIDSGIDLDHPDLASQIVPGWDFIGNDASPDDVLGHGTAVASVIAAAQNGVGIEGVAPGVLVMPLKVCGDTLQQGCPLDKVTQAVIDAESAGADIINLSLGGQSFYPPLFDAVAAFSGLVVAAAGNSGTNNDTSPFYPAAFELPNVMAVASTNHNDVRSGFSNYGAMTVHLAAPGENILMAIPNDTWNDGTWDGTSFAAPHVAGVAALMISANSGLSAEGLSARLMASVDLKASLADTTISGGRLNAHTALVGPYRPIARVEILPEQPTEDEVTFRGTGSSDIDGTIVSYQWSFSDGSTASGATVIKSMVGVDLLSGSLTVTDDDGVTGSIQFEIDFDARPVAFLTATPTLAMAPVAVFFDASDSFDPEGSTVTYAWDGVSAEGATPTRLFTQGGVHEVGVTVEDQDGLTDRATVELLIGTDFADMDDSTFVLDVAWISALGITRGCNPPTNDRYCPDDPVTRGQMAAFLTRALNLPSAPNTFTDDNGHIFENDIAALAAAGITRGCNPPTNDRYCPDDPVTRGQMAAFLHRALAT